ncbi:hypothetical protein MMC27_007098, partial [Xylographa pallens]|nr:hypothetical protein [Xylographa pallens]
MVEARPVGEILASAIEPRIEGQNKQWHVDYRESATQHNSYDCRIFVIANAISVVTLQPLNKEINGTFLRKKIARELCNIVALEQPVPYPSPHKISDATSITDCSSNQLLPIPSTTNAILHCEVKEQANDKSNTVPYPSPSKTSDNVSTTGYSPVY